MGRNWMCRAAAVGMAALLCTFCGCSTYTKSPDTVTPKTVTTAAQTGTQLPFPITLPDSGLIVEELVCYQGQYWEDGTGDAVTDVAGLMISNPTDRMVKLGAFALEQGGRTLYFFVYRLPPNSRCLVLEKSRQTCDSQKVTDCRELIIRWDYQELSRTQIDYVGLGPLMTIINRDTHQQSHVTVWYKRYVKEENYYLGGAAYSAHIFQLEPEERRTIQPEHYESNCARIVGIQLET